MSTPPPRYWTCQVIHVWAFQVMIVVHYNICVLFLHNKIHLLIWICKVNFAICIIISGCLLRSLSFWFLKIFFGGRIILYARSAMSSNSLAMIIRLFFCFFTIPKEALLLGLEITHQWPPALFNPLALVHSHALSPKALVEVNRSRKTYTLLL